MQIKYTQNTMDKLEQLLDEGGYVVRYEKGNFNSGYCVLEHKKVVVVNRFLNIEGRINILIDLVPVLKLDSTRIQPELLKFHDQIVKLSKVDMTENRADKNQRDIGPVVE